MARARVLKVNRKYGKQWEVRWSWTERGKRRFDQLAFGTKAEADAFAIDLNAQLQRGYVPKVGDGRRLFSEYSDEWLASLVHLTPRTRDGYRKLLDNHVLPVFGERQLVEIRRSDCEDFVHLLERKGL